jgi:hypothetical protein
LLELERVLAEIEDYLMPALQLDPIERTLYYHLLRHTHVVGKDSALVGLLGLAKSVGLSEDAARKRIRAMHEKGCIEIRDRSKSGHLIRVLLPAEIDGLVPRDSDSQSVDIETIDFFSNRLYVHPLLARENGRCFYCLKDLSADACVLDHVVPQMTRPDNSYRNVVVACHECNAYKQGRRPDDFLRALYRRGTLSQDELEERLTSVERLQRGELVPVV